MFISRQTPLLTVVTQYHTNLILSDIVFTVWIKQYEFCALKRDFGIIAVAKDFCSWFGRLLRFRIGLYDFLDRLKLNRRQRNCGTEQPTIDCCGSVGKLVDRRQERFTPVAAVCALL